MKFGLNGFIIARDTEKEAKETLREIIAKANRPAVQGFHDAVQQAGNSTADKRGMWADSSFEDLVQYNDGFRTRLIGTPEQIAERIAAYRKRGVDLVLGGFLHFQEEIEYFGARVLPWCARSRRPSRVRRRAGSRVGLIRVAAPAGPADTPDGRGRLQPGALAWWSDRTKGPFTSHNRHSAARHRCLQTTSTAPRSVTRLEERP